jgi:hypothetical protein
MFHPSNICKIASELCSYTYIGQYMSMYICVRIFSYRPMKSRSGDMTHSILKCVGKQPVQLIGVEIQGRGLIHLVFSRGAETSQYESIEPNKLMIIANQLSSDYRCITTVETDNWTSTTLRRTMTIKVRHRWKMPLNGHFKLLAIAHRYNKPF